MWFSPSLVLMFLSIFTSIFLVLSSPSLFISWVGLELNILVFLPIMLSKKSSLTSEASIKYFLTQTLASILIIISSLVFFLELTILANLILLVGLAIKLGAAPFHSWVLSVAETLGWSSLFILLTIQKINPLFILWSLVECGCGLFNLLIISSLIVGGVMGLVQTSTRLLMTFSSINHIGWLLVSLSFDLWLGSLYFFIYSIVLLAVVLLFDMFNISHINELFLINFGLSKQVLVFLSMLSLGGLPPFLGFLPKWLVLQASMEMGYYLLSLIMILGSLFTLFFYLRITFSAFILSGSNIMNLYILNKLSHLNLIFLSFSILGLPLFLFV